jgi:excisionase family DNA binding protein
MQRERRFAVPENVNDMMIIKIIRTRKSEQLKFMRTIYQSRAEYNYHKNSALKNRFDSPFRKKHYRSGFAGFPSDFQPNQLDTMHNLMTVKETAEYLRMPIPTVYYLVQRGQLPAIQIGGRWRVKKDAIDRDVLHTEEQGQPTVLVVDDDPGLQSMFKLFLKKQGFSRLVVGTGKEAVAAMQKQKFDLCFLDLQLPDFTGDEVYAQAKEIQPDLPFVIITGFPDSQMLDNILQHGPVTVLKKPLEVEKLQQTLRMLGHKAQAAKAA